MTRITIPMVIPFLIKYGNFNSLKNKKQKTEFPHFTFPEFGESQHSQCSISHGYGATVEPNLMCNKLNILETKLGVDIGNEPTSSFSRLYTSFWRVKRLESNTCTCLDMAVWSMCAYLVCLQWYYVEIRASTSKLISDYTFKWSIRLGSWLF